MSAFSSLRFRIWKKKKYIIPLAYNRKQHMFDFTVFA